MSLGYAIYIDTPDGSLTVFIKDCPDYFSQGRGCILSTNERVAERFMKFSERFCNPGISQIFMEGDPVRPVDMVADIQRCVASGAGIFSNFEIIGGHVPDRDEIHAYLREHRRP